MGIICDTSLLIAAEKKRFDLASFFLAHPHDEFWLAAVSASELLHGAERATDTKHRTERRNFVEGVLKQLAIAPFGSDEARHHARLWATLESKGTIIGPHDLLIAATALSLGYPLATLNENEFRRVPGLKLIETAAFMLP
jgi:tRNA(fMet)-specific endonuclease VapC